MASPEDPAKNDMKRLSPLESAKVHVTSDDRLRVEFKIDDLVRKLLPIGEVESSCGGCRGCMGCSMIDFSPTTERQG